MLVQTRPRVIILHPDFDRVSTNQRDLLIRFNRYGANLANVSGGMVPGVELWIGTKRIEADNSDTETYENLVISRLSKSSRSAVVFTLKAMFKLRTSRGENIMLIAGDLATSLLTLNIAKCFYPKVCTQITFHGDLPNGKSLGKRIRTAFQKKVVRFASVRATKIRVVSQHLGKFVADEFKVDPSRIFISPIPISAAIPSQIRRKYTHKVGFVGRLHQERGVDEALRILDHLLSSFPSLQVCIAGDGPEFSKVLNWSFSHDVNTNIEILGNLDTDEIMKLFSELTVLLSTASHEGYGMTIREAALSGVQVVARLNAGTREAKANLGSSLFLYESEEGAIEKITEVLSKVPDLPDGLSKLIENQIQFDLESEKLLATQWWIECSGQYTERP